MENEPTTAQPYLRVNDLRVRFDTEDGVVRAVDGVSFAVERGRTLGIVGESGSGKSVTSLAILGLHDPQADHRHRRDPPSAAGSWSACADEEVRRLRGRDMAMIFQDPLSALHPYYTVGRQIAEAYRVHHPQAGRREARQRAVDMLGRVGIPQPARRFDQYPHEFSGGMRQRAMIAMALVNDPDLLIADEPTTALDVTVQAQILDLLADLQARVPLRDHPDHPRPRRGRPGRRRRAGDVRRAGGRVRQRRAGAAARRSTRTPGGCWPACRRCTATPTRTWCRSSGNPPSLINLPSGLRVPPALPLRRRATATGRRTEVPELRAGRRADGHLVACHLPTRSAPRLYRRTRQQSAWPVRDGSR